MADNMEGDFQEVLKTEKFRLKEIRKLLKNLKEKKSIKIKINKFQ